MFFFGGGGSGPWMVLIFFWGVLDGSDFLWGVLDHGWFWYKLFYRNGIWKCHRNLWFHKSFRVRYSGAGFRVKFDNLPLKIDAWKTFDFFLWGGVGLVFKGKVLVLGRPLLKAISYFFTPANHHEQPEFGRIFFGSLFPSIRLPANLSY